MNKLEKLEKENAQLQVEISADFQEQYEIASHHLDETANTILEFKYEINNRMNKPRQRIRAWEQDEYQEPEALMGSAAGLDENKR